MDEFFRPDYEVFRGHRDTRRNRSYPSYALVALVSAIIGGLLVGAMFTYMPIFQGRRPYLYEPPSGQGVGTPTAPGSAETAAAYVSERVAPAVVGIINKSYARDLLGRTYERISGGTGVIFDSNGYIVTNNHVIEGASELIVLLADGQRLPAQVVGADKATDLAVIKVNAANLPVATFGNSDAVRVGELAVAIGNPIDIVEFQRTVTAGIISGLNRKLSYGERTFNLIQTDAAINPGNSGGPLCNARGEVIGINTLKLQGADREGLGFAIPINTVRTIVNQLVQYGRVIRPWLGVAVMDKATAARYNIQIAKGLYVGEVITGSPAAAAGVRPGDIILTIDGQAVNTVEELRAVLDTKKPGDRVSVVIVRSGRERTFQATLSEIPESLNR
ncbi:MAG: trypsin-like peptidase domain-containing protein [Bacillota bacterium]